MFKRILVPLDGSALAEEALPVAGRLALASGGAVVLVRVINPVHELGILPLEVSPYLEEKLDDATTQGAAYLTHIAGTTLPGIHTRIAVASGSVATDILDVARDEEIDLIVMNSHGYSGFKRWALGSIAQKVIHHSSIPVLLLRKHEHSARALLRPVRALVALDGSSFAEAALQPGMELVTALSTPARGGLHLTQLVKVFSAEEEHHYEQSNLDVDIRQATLRHGSDYLQALRERLCQEMVDMHASITWSVEECSDVAETLITLAERGEGLGLHHPCDLLVMATHGRGGLQRWFMGSVTERVLEHSSLPVLVVRPQELGAKQPEEVQEKAQGVGLD